ncbi:DUF308 domain-containing protein [Methanospirillum sp.]|uniref:HdeD family acid-resistance protein n=1 Tax=Methanospirillum sp. TaxID=45200 RepID=UPI002C031891|nr:DUF308 domain-containing protein [Methanospirillum sp.]HPP78221.1 DUF308 domain-containing protein [Methanospirillum sp.]
MSRQAGMVAILIGLLMLVFSPFIPGIIGVFLAAVIFLISLMLVGIGSSVRGSGFSVPFILLGLIGVCVSLYALFNPDMTVSLMGILLGVVILMMGIMQLGFSSGFVQDRISWLFLIIGGMLSTLVGFYLILYPQDGMQLLIVFIGCYLIAYGVIGVIRGGSSQRYIY